MISRKWKKRKILSQNGNQATQVLWKDAGKYRDWTEDGYRVLDKRRITAAPRNFLRVCCNRSRGERAFSCRAHWCTMAFDLSTSKQPQVDVRTRVATTAFSVS